MQHFLPHAKLSNKFPLSRLISSSRGLCLVSAHPSRSILEFSRSSRQWPLSQRALSSPSKYPDDLFNYNSGRWLANDKLRLAERRREFEVEELCQLAAQSVGRKSQDINRFEKLAEGGFNRTFLITMHDGFEMVARIPYPITVPKFYAVASEVATMDFLRFSGLPIPEIYGYSPSADNAAKTEYIFMEFVKGTRLTDVWMAGEIPDVLSSLRQIVELESRIMSVRFPAGGSLYYTKDLEEMGGNNGVTLEDERFSVGPDARIQMWSGRRSQLDVDRGPYRSPEVALVAAAVKERVYLEHFAQPVLPFRRERRQSYDFEKQSPADHIENLDRYLRIAPLLMPQNPVLHHFRMRHPDLHPSNVIVSRSEKSNELIITGLLDWQHASILPLFLSAEMPERFQNYDDSISQALIPPLLPENIQELDKPELTHALTLYIKRLPHFHYIKNMEKHNKLHYEAFSDPLSMFIGRLCHQAGVPWQGETHDLKAALTEATERWEELTGGDVPCPIAFEPEDLHKTKELGERLRLADEDFEAYQDMIGIGAQTWSLNEDYSKGKKMAELLKLQTMMQLPKEMQDSFEANWFCDDMDETPYT
ncbi:protein kinase subdomain-containing protein PKL/CAK/Fmp29 [Sistotremastrum suecicum HHB10207 ss-3]|uniref:Protein kinase subdomain-containing protein PKL/CAK/Fmp29 n=1 Tax=Sistotremastrum suecicum HHB10207 ss-3 TaxID=1314776 RepID=A0A165YNY9_9AGAM|nr:protein kinase subdomain-containing protein PKL/CAK/Fmp29 [Sistotremastrum suecicum HHB10207 ss-3]